MVIPTQTTKQIFGRYFLGHTISAQTCGRKPWGTKSLEVVCNPHRKSWRINPWRRRGGRFKTNPGSGVISRGIYIWYPHRKWTRLLVGISSWSFLNTLISWCIWSPSLWICFLKTNLLIAQAVSPFSKNVHQASAFVWEIVNQQIFSYQPSTYMFWNSGIDVLRGVHELLLTKSQGQATLLLWYWHMQYGAWGLTPRMMPSTKLIDTPFQGTPKVYIPYSHDKFISNPQAKTPFVEHVHIWNDHFIYSYWQNMIYFETPVPWVKLGKVPLLLDARSIGMTGAVRSTKSHS